MLDALLDQRRLPAVGAVHPAVLIPEFFLISPHVELPVVDHRNRSFGTRGAILRAKLTSTTWLTTRRALPWL